MAQEGNYYIVEGGDSYERIAGKVYSDQRMFAELMSANGGVYLRPGMKIVLPAKIDNPFVSNEKAAEFGMATNAQYRMGYDPKTNRFDWANTGSTPQMNRDWAYANATGQAEGLKNGLLPSSFTGLAGTSTAQTKNQALSNAMPIQWWQRGGINNAINPGAAKSVKLPASATNQWGQAASTTVPFMNKMPTKGGITTPTSGGISVGSAKWQDGTPMIWSGTKWVTPSEVARNPIYSQGPLGKYFQWWTNKFPGLSGVYQAEYAFVNAITGNVLNKEPTTTPKYQQTYGPFRTGEQPTNRTGTQQTINRNMPEWNYTSAEKALQLSQAVGGTAEYPQVFTANEIAALAINSQNQQLKLTVNDVKKTLIEQDYIETANGDMVKGIRDDNGNLVNPDLPTLGGSNNIDSSVHAPDEWWGGTWGLGSNHFDPYYGYNEPTSYTGRGTGGVSFEPVVNSEKVANGYLNIGMATG